MNTGKYRELANVPDDIPGRHHFPNTPKHGFNVGFGFALGKFRQQRCRRFRNAAAGAYKADVRDLIAIEDEKEFKLVAAKRIVALGRGGGLRHFVEIARLLAMVKDDLLIKVVDIVKHIFNLPQGAITPRPGLQGNLFTQMMIGFKPVPNQLVQFFSNRIAFDALDNLSGKRMN